jgi:hypothetical protein
MYIPKRYGDSKKEACPFCKKQATTVSKEGIPVCVEHKNASLPEMKCACGSTLDLKNGKFGVFYNCLSCGNQSLSRVLEINDVSDANKAIKKNFTTEKMNKKAEPEEKKNPKERCSFVDLPDKKNSREIIVRADDPFYCN